MSFEGRKHTTETKRKIGDAQRAAWTPERRAEMAQRMQGGAALLVTYRKPATEPGVLGEIIDQFLIPSQVVEIIRCEDETMFVLADGRNVHEIDVEYHFSAAETETENSAR